MSCGVVKRDIGEDYSSSDLLIVQIKFQNEEQFKSWLEMLHTFSSIIAFYLTRSLMMTSLVLYARGRKIMVFQ